MAGQLPTEFYIHPRPGGADAVEHICAQATNRPAVDVVAVAVAPAHVARAADLLFGTGIGVVSTIEDLSADLIDQARRSVAQGATEIALPSMILNQAAALTRLRSRLGPFTPVTVGMHGAHEGLDLALAERALRLGADFISFCPGAASPTARQDITTLLALARDLQLGGVKIEAAEASHAALLHSETRDLVLQTTRLCVPIFSTAA